MAGASVCRATKLPALHRGEVWARSGRGGGGGGGVPGPTRKCVLLLDVVWPSMQGTSIALDSEGQVTELLACNACRVLPIIFLQGDQAGGSISLTALGPLVQFYVGRPCKFSS